VDEALSAGRGFLKTQRKIAMQVGPLRFDGGRARTIAE
jgi:hypothetical protein